MRTLEQCRELTLKWSYDRGILTNGKATTQSLKLVSEVGELCSHIVKREDIKDDIGDCLVVMTNLANLTGGILVLVRRTDLIQGPDEDMGCLLTEAVGNLCDNVAKDVSIDIELARMFDLLDSLAFKHDTSLEECWNIAYEDIKDRKGFLNANGNFVKSTDPRYQQLLMEFENDKTNIH